MLIRISLIVAIIAGLAIGVGNMTVVKDKITTIQKQREEQRTAKEAALKDAHDTHLALNKTNAILKTTLATLEATTAERDKAVAEASAKTKELDATTKQLADTRKQRDDAQAELAAFKQTELTPLQIINMSKQYKALQAENETIARVALDRFHKIQTLTNRLAKYEEQDYQGPALPANLRGKVLVTDPKWNFVILDVGQEQGMLEYGELLVNRNGRLVAKLQVRSVQKDRCVANVLPGWKLGEVMEGDQVTPAHPES